MRRARWADVRHLANGWPYRLLVKLGVLCSPSLHYLGICTRHGR